MRKYLSAKISNKKQKTRFYITDNHNQDFRKLIKQFRNQTFLCYKSKQAHDEPTEAYLLPTKQITKLMKTEKNV